MQRSQADLDAHLAKPQVAELFRKWGARMVSETRKFDAVNERAPL